MKKTILILCFIFLPACVTATPATFFKTGWELNVALDAKSGNCTNFSDSGSPSCTNNPYCNGGYVDSTFNYNAPFDMPGYCFSHNCTTNCGTGQAPYFNHVLADYSDEAAITSSQKVNGTYSVGLYNSSNYTARTQLTIVSDRALPDSSVHNFNETLTKAYYRFSKMPASGTHVLWYEWYGSSPTYIPGRLMFENVSGTTYLRYFGGATAYGSADWYAQTAITPSDWLNNWVEVIIYHRQGGAGVGRCIVTIKPSGGSETTLINWTGDNNDDGDVYHLMPAKNYGNGTYNSWVYVDDLTIYVPNGPSDLPTMDGTADSDPPTPNPATISSSPAGDSTTTISMTANVGTDATPPISYQFLVDPDSDDCAGAGCGSLDAGCDDSGWQESDTTYTDTGIGINGCCCYAVQMKDSLDNTGTASSTSSKAVSYAATPGSITLGNATDTTLDITEIDENGNQAGTWIAIKCVSTSPNDSDWIDKWVNPDDGEPAGSEDWTAFETWDAEVTLGTGGTALESDTQYCFQGKAINAKGVETDLGTLSCISTTGGTPSVSTTVDGGTITGGSYQ